MHTNDALSIPYNADITLLNAIMIQVPAQHAAHYRPYQSNFNDQIAGQLLSDTNGLTNVNPGSLRHVSRSFLAPSQQSHGTIDITNGWDTPRFSVFLEFKYDGYVKGGREILCGFTDYCGVTANGIVDPNMVIYFNNMIQLYDQSVNGPNGRMLQSSVQANTQLLNPTPIHTREMGMVNSQYSLKPSSALQAWQMSNETDVLDTRTFIRNEGVSSDRSNLSPTQYMNKTISAYRHSINNDDSPHQSSQYIAGCAAAYVSDANVLQQQFFQRIKHSTQYEQTGSITYGELMQLFPEIEHNDRLTVTYSNSRQLTDNRTRSEHWGGADPETNVAFALSTAVPSAMSNNLLVAYQFSATNQTLDGSIQISTLPQTNTMFDSVDVHNAALQMESSLMYDVLPEILHNRVGTYHITMTANLMGDSFIEVSLDGGEIVPFTAANYCDSVSTPLLAVDEHQTGVLGTDLKQMLDTVTNPNRQEYVV